MLLELTTSNEFLDVPPGEAKDEHTRTRDEKYAKSVQNSLVHSAESRRHRSRCLIDIKHTLFFYLSLTVVLKAIHGAGLIDASPINR